MKGPQGGQAPLPHPEFQEASSGFPVGTLSRWDRGAVPTASELQKVWLEGCRTLSR